MKLRNLRRVGSCHGCGAVGVPLYDIEGVPDTTACAGCGRQTVRLARRRYIELLLERDPSLEDSRIVSMIQGRFALGHQAALAIMKDYRRWRADSKDQDSEGSGPRQVRDRELP